MALRKRYGKSSSSRRGVYISSADNDLGPQVLTFNARQLQNDTGPILRTAIKQKHEAIEISKSEQLSQLYEYVGESASSPTDADVLANEVMAGNLELPVSHAGGEFLAILLDESEAAGKRTRYKDPRTRRDRVQNIVDGFMQQRDEMVKAFMQWEHAQLLEPENDKAPLKGMAGDPEGHSLLVVDIISTYTLKVDCQDSNIGIPSVLIRRGMIPSSPYVPHHAFSIRLLEFFRHTHLRCPHLSIDAYIKGVCDSHGLPYRQPISKQFTIAYDAYLQIRNNIQSRIDAALKRDSPRWRLRNACPACTHKLEGEPSLLFSMLVTMDGNDLLKRVLRKVAPKDVDGDGPSPLQSRELLDNRQPPGDYYVTSQEVDQFSREQANDVLPIEKDSPCASRWNNMSKEKISRMWGVFDESGIFLSLCRHGYTLVAADMVQSGEQSKYPLAVVDVLLDTFGSRLGVGYDIGCRFSTTIATSSLGLRAQELEYKSLVGSFHGHVHNRACQLDHLATYVEGMGLEDLEGCERFFSKSNALASSVRYSSKFHRKQRIVEFMKHMDKRETSQQLSQFLVNNYKQALKIIKGEGNLQHLMKIHGVTDVQVFHTWLEEERTYLKSLTREPPEETIEIEYYLKLKALADAEQKLASINFIPYNANASTTKRDTSALRQYHQQERINNLITVVQGLEDIIKPDCRWKEGSEPWKRAEELAYKRDYQRALDNLERLVVQRMFELSYMNMAQSGYHYQKHIAKALQARSEAIRTALAKYNEAARKLRPPRETLEWEQVVEYSFLSDFDLLRDTRQDIRKQPWASPVGRSMRDQYFKIIRAREEITRLNIEIRRVITHMHEESQFLKAHEIEIAKTDHLLAYQVHRYRMQRTQYNELHRERFEKLKNIPGFTGVLEPGTSVDKTLHDGFKHILQLDSEAAAATTLSTRHIGGDFEEEDEDAASDIEEQELEERFNTLMSVTY